MWISGSMFPSNVHHWSLLRIQARTVDEVVQNLTAMEKNIKCFQNKVNQPDS